MSNEVWVGDGWVSSDFMPPPRKNNVVSYLIVIGLVVGLFGIATARILGLY